MAEIPTSGGSIRPSIKEILAPSSARGLEFYLAHTGLAPKDLEGKHIVNLGAGGTNINAALTELGVKPAGVVNIDRKYPRNFGYGTPDNAVRADMLQTPLPANSTDIVFSSDAMTRWLSKERQPAAYLEAARILKEGGKAYVFIFDWQSIKPEEIFLTVKEKYPEVDISYDRKSRTLVMEKKETLNIFDEDGPVPEPEKMLEEIKNENLRANVKKVIQLGFENQDIDSGISGNEFMTCWELVKNLVHGGNIVELYGVDRDDVKAARKILAACVDAGKEFSNNSRFDRANHLRIATGVVTPSGWMPAKGDRLLKIAQNIDPSKVSVEAKLAALERSFLFTWANRNKPYLEQLKDDKTGWWVATNFLKRNIFDVVDTESKTGEALKRLIEEKKTVSEYFKELLTATKQGKTEEERIAAKTKLEIFRVLGYKYETDEVWSEFTQMYDPAIYDAARYLSSTICRGVVPGPNIDYFKAVATRWGKRLSVNGVEAGGRWTVYEDRNDASPEEYAQTVIKLMSTSRNQLKLKQLAMVPSCPGCYGYAEGFKAQSHLQENMGHEVNKDGFDPKRAEFANKAITAVGGYKFSI